ncbi:MAG: hypothetical protein WAW92_03000, partial [Minisyncoccia bacterium]
MRNKIQIGLIVVMIVIGALLSIRWAAIRVISAIASVFAEGTFLGDHLWIVTWTIRLFVVLLIVGGPLAFTWRRLSHRMPSMGNFPNPFKLWNYRVAKVIVGLLAIHTILWYFPPTLEFYREHWKLNPQYILMSLVVSFVGFSMFPGNPTNPSDHKIGRWAAFSGVIMTVYL